MDRVLQARIIFWAVDMLRRLYGNVNQNGDADLTWGVDGDRDHGLNSHLAIFEDCGAEFLLNIADAVGDS